MAKMKRKGKKKPNSPDIKVKNFKGGLSVHLPNREEMEYWLNAFDKRFYGHLGQDPDYENLLVQWEAENGNAPVLTNEGKLDPEENKQLTILKYVVAATEKFFQQSSNYKGESIVL